MRPLKYPNYWRQFISALFDSARWMNSSDDDPIGAVSAESLGISLHTGVRRRLRSGSYKRSPALPAHVITRPTARGPIARLTKRGRCQTPNGDVPELEDISTDMPSTVPTNLSPERGASDSAQAAVDISNSRNASRVGTLRSLLVGLLLGFVLGAALTVQVVLAFFCP